MVDINTASSLDFSSVVISTINSLTTELVGLNNAANTTTQTVAAVGSIPNWAGFLGCLVATLFFGSNLVPVKQYSAGDGIFFQLAFCVPVFAVGLIVDLILGNQRFFPLVLIGGALWSTGAIFSVFCIKTCGLTVGILIWSTTSLIMGWAGGRFGVFGVKAQVPPTTSKLIMNYFSVILAAASAVFFLFIKSDTKKAEPHPPPPDVEPLPIEVIKAVNGEVEPAAILETDFPFLNRLSDPFQKVLGSIIAAFSGLFYGLMFIPDQYIRDHPEKFLHNNEPPPNNGLYYVQSQYSGILLTSMVYFIIYTIFKRNKPAINPSIALPAMISGAMWAIANVGFIVAISSLKSAVAYPIVSVLPGIVTSLWSLFWFREIQGKGNYIFLVLGMIVRIVAALLSALSA